MDTPEKIPQDLNDLKPVENAPPTLEQLQEQLTAQEQKFKEQLDDKERNFRDRETALINSLNNQNTQQQQPASKPSISREEALRFAQEEGDITKAMDYFEHQLGEVKTTYEKRIADLQLLGGSQISSLAVAQAEADPTMEHFKRYKSEIMTVVQKSGSSDPAVVREAYKYVVGNHMTEILKEEKEKMLRQAVDDGTMLPGGGKGGRSGDMKDRKKPEDVYSEQGLHLLNRKGINADQFLQKVGKTMPFVKLEENTKPKRTTMFQDGLNDLEKMKAENAQIEEEIQWT